MFEYDNELKLRSLDAWGFDVQSLDINKIMHVLPSFCKRPYTA